VTDFYRRTAEAYRIDGIRCDGMDVESFYSVMKEIADDCRATRRPYFVEAITYRYRGHSMSDPATTYRTQDEVKQWEGSRDPIRTLERRHPELFPQEVIDKFEAEVAAEVEDAVQFALASPFPDLNEMFTDNYVDCPGYPGAEVSPNKYEYEYKA
jgi:pyruvate dehydrogenase E1 component alpha subunit